MLDLPFKTFMVVVEKGSLSAAAEALYLTQPAVSVRIQNLEKALGIQLFYRESKGLKITKAGELFYQKVCQLDSLWEQTIQEITSFSSEFDFKLKMMSSPTPGLYILPNVCSRFKSKYESINASIYIGNTKEAVDKVYNNEFYLGFTAGDCALSGKLSAEKIFEDEMVLVVSHQHPWAKEKVITREMAAESPIIHRESSSHSCTFITEQFKKLGVDINDNRFFLDLGSIEALKSAVKSNLGYSILSKYAVVRELYEGEFVKVALEDVRFTRPICAIYKNINYLPKVYKSFLSFIRGLKTFE